MTDICTWETCGGCCSASCCMTAAASRAAASTLVVGFFGAGLVAFFTFEFSELPLVRDTPRTFWWVRRCCSMLSLRVKAFLHSGQNASFLPVCFFAWRAAWPEVVK